MSEHDQSRKFTEKSAEIVRETLAEGKAAAEQSTWVTVENIRDYNLKIMDMARANTEAVFELAHELTTAKGPSDMVEIWTEQARKQFELLNEQTKELAALGQKIASESVEPINRSVRQVFKKAS